MISVFYARRAVLGKPLLMIDAAEFTDCRSGRTAAWNDVELVRATTQHGTFGLDHRLRLDLKASITPGLRGVDHDDQRDV